jgi:HSP20 family protein
MMPGPAERRGRRIGRKIVTLARFDPFHELDRLFEQNRRVQSVIPMDAYRRDDDFIVHFDVPGVSSEDLELTVEQNTLTLVARRRWEPREGDAVIAQERRQGEFRRELLLGDSLDAGQMEATLDDGVLTIRIPVAAAAQPRRIDIRSSGGPIEVEAAPSEDSSAAPPL